MHSHGISGLQDSSKQCRKHVQMDLCPSNGIILNKGKINVTQIKPSFTLENLKVG
jgi:hypothetical protein